MANQELKQLESLLEIKINTYSNSLDEVWKVLAEIDMKELYYQVGCTSMKAYIIKRNLIEKINLHYATIAKHIQAWRFKIEKKLPATTSRTKAIKMVKAEKKEKYKKEVIKNNKDAEKLMNTGKDNNNAEILKRIDEYEKMRGKTMKFKIIVDVPTKHNHAFKAAFRDICEKYKVEHTYQ